MYPCVRVFVCGCLLTQSVHLCISQIYNICSFPVFYGNRRFNTEFTRALYLSLFWARPIQSTLPHSTSTRSILILSNHLRLGLPSGLLPSGFPTNKSTNHEALRYAVFFNLLYISSLFGPNTPGLCSSLNVRDQVSHPYRTTGKIIVLFILIFKFFDGNREDGRFWIQW
jgi:hypothetical protein